MHETETAESTREIDRTAAMPFLEQISTEFGLPVTPHLDDYLIEDLSLDSLDVLNLVEFIEELANSSELSDFPWNSSIAPPKGGAQGSET